MDKKVILYTALMFVLVVAIACGSAPAEPVVIEKEVI